MPFKFTTLKIKNLFIALCFISYHSLTRELLERIVQHTLQEDFHLQSAR